MRQTALLSGIAYLMIFITGFYANFSILESLVDVDAPYRTTTNFIEQYTSFGYGLIGFWLMVFFDLILVYTLFVLTKKVSKNLSYIASAFRLMHAVLFGFAMLKLGEIYTQTYQAKHTQELQDSIMLLIADFDERWTIGLLFFGIHLVFLGYLSIKSTFIPKVIGLLLILAAMGYFVDGTAKLFLPNYTDYQPYFDACVILTGVVGELSFTIWLLSNMTSKKAEGVQALS